MPMKRFDERTRLFMEFFAKEMGVKFRDADTGELIGVDENGELTTIKEEQNGRRTNRSGADV